MPFPLNHALMAGIALVFLLRSFIAAATEPEAVDVPNANSPPLPSSQETPVTTLKTSPILEDNAANPATSVKAPTTFLRADKVKGQKDQFMDAEGHAEIRRQGMTLSADHIHYDQTTDTAEATGHVVLNRNNSLMLYSPHGFYQLGGEIGVMDQPRFFYSDPNTLLWTPPPPSYVVPLPGTPIARPPLWFATGTAKEMDLTAGDKESLLNGDYSTCRATNPDWYIHSPQLDLDHTTQEGDAHPGTLNFKGLPLLYSPDLGFPLDNQRRSGFLSPIIGSAVTTGEDIAIPYYINLAPNIDDTITPRLMTSRGLQLGNEVRYLDPTFSGILDGEYLPHDAQLGTDRWFATWNHHQTLAPGLNFTANMQSASDPNYMNDLNTLIGPQGLVYLPRSLDLSYSGLSHWVFDVNSLNYQPLLGGTSLYRIDPQLSAHGFLTDWHGLNLDFNSQYTNFISPGPNTLAGTAVANGITYNGNYQSIVSGSRLHLNPTVTVPWRNNAAYVVFKTGLDFTQYNLGQFNTSPLGVYDRTLPITSLDAGLFMDRHFSAWGQDYQQTLEPRLYYVYIPYRNQNMLPIFDTGLADFNSTTIFTENQYNGIDRINNANQLTAAVTSRLLDPTTGGEMLKTLLAERFYFTPNQVLLPGEVLPPSSASDIIAALTANITQRWNFDSYINVGAQSHRTQQMAASLAYTPAPGKVFNMGYRIDTPLQGLPATVINYLGQTTTYIPGITGPIPINDLTSVKQWDVSAQWPITNRLSFLGRLAYSSLDNQVLEALSGVEYNGGCWAVRAIASRFPVSPIQTDTAFYVQLELGPLGLGPNPLDTLRYNIPGYTKTNEISPQ
ncbi:MAG: LPS assembly protein LptD [Betaproteobacteria bacterium]|nr:LPS assembly protein LptD [Betaproteobacteria bacterium]